ncbi:MAG: hypothetical protein WKF88_00630 [Ferruginibacter sp.]
MKRSRHIRILSLFLILVFALSITPKIVLHNMFAGHIDTVPRKDSKVPLEVSTTGFNCDKDGVVATSPFVADGTILYSFSFHYFSPYVPGQVALSAAVPVFDPLRGPPPAILKS